MNTEPKAECPPLYRNLRGTVHRPGCDYARSGRPWRWAEGRSLEDVAEIVRRDGSGLKACGHCQPFIAVARKNCTCSECGHRHYVYPGVS